MNALAYFTGVSITEKKICDVERLSQNYKTLVSANDAPDHLAGVFID